MDLRLRTPTPADAAAAGRICHDAFRAIAERHGFPPDFPSRDVATGLLQDLFAKPGVHSLVAEVDGRVAGSNFLWERDEIAGVGPITVDPELQNGAIGKRLMRAVLERAEEKGFRAVRLVQAAYHSRSLSLYTKLGFVAREPLPVLHGKPLAPGGARPAVEADLAAANALCRRVHGHDRGEELKQAIRAGSATVTERDGRLAGYATEVGFFGHAVGETTADLAALIAAAPAFTGPGFL